MKWLLFLMLSLAMSIARAGAEGVSAEASVMRGVKAIEAAYTRYHARVDINGQQVPALSDGNLLFPAWGFAPTPFAFSWSLAPIDIDRSQLRVRVPVQSLSAWRGAVRGLAIRKMTAAAADYSPVLKFVPPATFPNFVYATKPLDRRNSRLPVVVPHYVGIDGLEVATKGTATVVLRASPGEVSTVVLTLSNIWGKGNTNDGKTPKKDWPGMSIVRVVTRPEFMVQHACSDVMPNKDCPVTISYVGGAPHDHLPGSMLITFSGGDYAVLSILGITRPK